MSEVSQGRSALTASMICDHVAGRNDAACTGRDINEVAVKLLTHSSLDSA